MKLRQLINIIVMVHLAVAIPISHADTADPTPFLAFSDLISGPAQGLGHPMGSGVVVTVWGQHLGTPERGGAKIYLKNTSGDAFDPYIFYWKDSDGKLPGGPANLAESHGMQEISFSIPNVPNGEYYIELENSNGTSNNLPFLVRSGKIFHLMSKDEVSSSNIDPDLIHTDIESINSFPAGSTIYLHDITVVSPSSPPGRGIYWNNSNASGDIRNQFSVIAFPGKRPTIYSQRAVEGYRTEGMVVSKLDLKSSNYLHQDSRGQPIGDQIWSNQGTAAIFSTKNGRAVANLISEIPGGCSSRMGGAINGAATFYDYVSNFKALGNEIFEYGCNGTSKLHHTTYLTVRSNGKNTQVQPWEWGFNYLRDNKAKFGIHQFDQNSGCGDLTGPLHIHNNVVVNQSGAAISIGSQCGWSMDSYIYNNVIINSGLAADWDGVNPMTSDGAENGAISIRDGGTVGLTGTMNIFNNTIIGHTKDRNDDSSGCLMLQGSADTVTVIFSNNTCIVESNKGLVGFGYRAQLKEDNTSGSHNLWLRSDAIAKAPDWDRSPISQPIKHEYRSSTIILQGEKARGIKTPIRLTRDIYGFNRYLESPVPGAIEGDVFTSAPPSPPNRISVE